MSLHIREIRHMNLPIRVDHTNCLQVVIKLIHSIHRQNHLVSLLHVSVQLHLNTLSRGQRVDTLVVLERTILTVGNTTEQTTGSTTCGTSFKTLLTSSTQTCTCWSQDSTMFIRKHRPCSKQFIKP
jgi:hypothetical protein